MDLKKKIKHSLNETLKESEIHGLSHCAKAKSQRLKLFWSICFVLSIFWCVYNIVTSFISFFDYKVIITDSLNYKSNSKLPAIDICNLNPYDGGVNKNITEYLVQKNNLKEDNFKNPKDYINNVTFLLKSNYENMSVNKEMDLYYAGFYLKQMLVSCTFQNIPCSEKDFFYFHDYNYGSCYKFNGGITNFANSSIKSKSIPINYVQKPGWQYGLQLELYVGSKSQQNFIYKKGVRVTVHHQSIEPFINKNGIDVQVGYQTNVAILSTVRYKLSNPYSNCLSNSLINWNTNDVLKFMKNSFSFTIYSQQFCLNVCFSQFILNQCGCIDLRFKVANLTSYKSCISIDDLNCISNKESEFNTNYSQDCYSKCPIECVSYMYHLEKTQASYPTKWYSKLLVNSSNFQSLLDESDTIVTDPETLKDTNLMVNIFYGQNFYHNITETPNLTPDSMIALIGGHFGFFLGMSLLTFIEFIEMIYNIIYLTLKYNLNRKVLNS